MPAINAYYRTFQFFFHFGTKFLPWRKAQPVKGAGAINEIPAILLKEGVSKVMVVTDPGLMAAGIAPRITQILEAAGMPYALYSEVQPNPTTDTIAKIYDLYQSSGCNGFVAIGGGSSMDAAKSAAVQAKYPDKTLQQLGGLLKARRKLDPFIAVPTTAGTGSETTVAALVTDSATHHKFGIMSMPLIPHYAILDPELTLGLPPFITACTGMDALCHAVESYLCWAYHTAESRGFALDAVSKIATNLIKVYEDGSDLKAREEMLDAAYKAGFAFTRAGVGNVHAIAHTLGGLYDAQHGLANAVILPVVVEDYGPKVYKKLAILGRAAGVAQDSTQDDVAAIAFIQFIRDLNKRMQIPEKFDFIKSEDIEQIITWILKEANPLYPVPTIYDRDHCRRVIEKIRV